MKLLSYLFILRLVRMVDVSVYCENNVSSVFDFDFIVITESSVAFL
jgi:hypothetical protein